jgi:mevalonate kinase
MEGNMDLISFAYAQATNTGQVSPSMPDWIFILVGGLIAVLALVLIFRQFTVTSGHALVLGIALAVACLPYVASFEWTDSGFKLTTKAVASELANEVKHLTEQDTAKSEQLKQVNEALKTASERIAALENASKPGEAIPTDTSEFDRLIKKNDTVIKNNALRIERLDGLTKTLDALKF